MKKVFFVSFFLVLLWQSSFHAQTFEWADKSGASVLGNGTSIAVDAKGNSYVTGSFFGRATFGSTEITAQSRDAFLVKYDPLGKVLWAKTIGGVADDFGNAVAIDKDGNCFLAGSFAASMVVGKDSLTSHSQHDIFVAKFNSKGEALWCRSAGGYYEDHAMVLSLDKAGNAYVAGFFKDTMWFTPEVSIVGKRISYFDMFLAKYDAGGKILWAKTAGGSNYQSQGDGLAIATDPKGTIYLSGFYRSEAQFDEQKLANKGSYAMFLSKYESSGKLDWVTSSTNDLSSVVAKGVAVDKKGNAYVTGTYTSTAGFDSISVSSKNMGYPDMFFAKYNPMGKIIWVRTTGGFGSKSPAAVAMDAQDNPYVFGSFRDTAFFGSSGVSSNGRETLFLVKYNSAGDAQWVKPVGRNGIISGKAMGIDASANIYMTGNFSDTGDFGKSPIIAKENTQDVFIAKLSPHVIATEKKLTDIPGPDFAFISCELNPKTKIATVKYSIPKSAYVLLDVDDLMGNVAESFLEGQRQSGVYEVKLDMKGIKGEGDFYCRLQADHDKQTKKMELKK